MANFRTVATTASERLIQEGHDEIVLVIKQLVKEQKKTNELLEKLIPQEPEVVVEEVKEPVKKAKKG